MSTPFSRFGAKARQNPAELDAIQKGVADATPFRYDRITQPEQ